jgi:hypothetical protein
MLPSIVPQDSPSVLSVADSAARLLLAGKLNEAQLLLEETPAASALVLDRALAIASALVRRSDVESFVSAADRIVDLLWGADAERTADVVSALGEQALALGEPMTCARLVSRASKAVTVLAIRQDTVRLSRLERLADAAVSDSRR